MTSQRDVAGLLLCGILPAALDAAEQGKAGAMAKTILVVDDERKIVTVLKGYLEQAGFRVVTAGDGQMALTTFRHAKPDLVVLDLMLPGMDGLDVCRTLRRESSVPIIMLTARAEEADRLIGLELGADDYVVKPFSPREVVLRVRDPAPGRRRSRRFRSIAGRRYHPGPRGPPGDGGRPARGTHADGV